MAKIDNLPDYLHKWCRLQPDRAYLYQREQGRYNAMSFKDVQDTIFKLARFLDDRDVFKGDRVAILANNSRKWVLADLAILSLGIISVPIYPTLSKEEAAYILKDAGAKVLVTDLADKQDIVALRQNNPDLTTIILMDGNPENIEGCIGFDEAIERVEKLPEFDPIKVNVSQEDVATIIYTSGTTGQPKGTILTHGNFIYLIEQAIASMPISKDDVGLSFLPLSHVFERFVGEFLFLGLGGQVYFADSIDTVRDDILEARPTLVAAVPRFFEKMYAGILDKMTGLKKPIFNWALKVGEEKANATANGGRAGFGVRIKHAIATRLVYSKIAKKMGGRLRYFISGGASLSEEIARFFRYIGITIIEGYGMTETTAVAAVNRADHIKIGSVGKPFTGTEAKLGDDNELLIRGPGIMKGYWNLPDRTAEALDEDGWMHTGDIADIDAEGYIRIVDRKKELLVLSNGKNVAPVEVETRCQNHEMIAQAFAVGDQYKFVSALIVPNFDKLLAYARQHNIAHSDREALLQDSRIIALYTTIIEEKCAGLSAYKMIKKFRLLAEEFAQETGELTPTLKPKRKVILDKYRDMVDEIYADDLPGGSAEGI